MKYALGAIVLAMFGFVLLTGMVSGNGASTLFVWALVLVGVLFLVFVVLRGVAARPRPDQQRVALLAFIAVAVLAAAPWVAPIFPGLLGDLMVWTMVIPTFAAVFLMARTLSPGLAIGASILEVLALTWAAGLSALLAYEIAWQGLDIRDVSGIDQGDGTGLALGIISLTALSPLLGFVIGLLSQIGKNRAMPVAL